MTEWEYLDRLLTDIGQIKRLHGNATSIKNILRVRALLMSAAAIYLGNRGNIDGCDLGQHIDHLANVAFDAMYEEVERMYQKGTLP